MQVELEKAQRNAGVVSELREDVRNAEREIERLQKLSSASLSVNGASPERRSSVGSLAGAKDEAATTRDQIVGLKAIVATLTEENQTLLERNKQLQSRFEDLGCVVFLPECRIGIDRLLPLPKSDSHKALEATVEKYVLLFPLPYLLSSSASRCSPRSPCCSNHDFLSQSRLLELTASPSTHSLMAQLDSSNPPSSPPTSRTTPATSRELDQLRFELKAVQRKAESDVQALNQEVRRFPHTRRCPD